MVQAGCCHSHRSRQFHAGLCDSHRRVQRVRAPLSKSSPSGTGVTALYFGGKTLMLEGGESAIGGECTDIQTVVVKTPSDHLWLRKFIRMEHASGPERIRTALRM